LLLLGAGLWACRSGEIGEADTRAAPAGRAPGAGGAGQPGTATASAGAPGERLKGPKASPPWRIPVGPNLLIMPGKGVGPIRFGARLDTIERLIGEPCEQKREEADGAVVCRYSAHATEFVLRGGELKEIRAHRMGRPFKPEPKLDFGIFNGRFESGAAFGMLEAGAQELLGKPKSIRKVDKPEAENPNLTVAVHEYDGFTLEYDQLGPDRVVLGGVILKAPK
jgi:hypothetical protein